MRPCVIRVIRVIRIHLLVSLRNGRNVSTSLLGPSPGDWASGTPRCCHRGRALEYRSARV